MNILLAVDGSDASLSAVATTAALDTPPGSTIEVVSVVPDSFAPEGSPWPNVIRIDPPTDRERVLDDVRGRLEEIATRLRTNDRSAEPCVLEGRPATLIVDEARRFGADLIVMGARGLSAVRRLLLGSVSSEVVDHAPCPVLVARGAAVRRILWATDGSPDAERVADFFVESHLFDSADIRVVSVVDAGMPWWPGFMPVEGATSIEALEHALDSAEQRAREIADRAAARLAEQRVLGVSIRPDGDVVSAILEEAQVHDADLIALGARHLGTIHRWLVGSVSRAVLHSAPMSVLVVREYGSDRSPVDPARPVVASST
jgi:nucleotide-binding universal stress UspA family protein